MSSRTSLTRELMRGAQYDWCAAAEPATNCEAGRAAAKAAFAGGALICSLVPSSRESNLCRRDARIVAIPA
jgi:hypothetical protein